MDFASPLALWLSSSPEAFHIPLAMLTVFGSAKLLAELFTLIGLPGLVGEICAGILIGPSMLALVQPDDFLTALAELGVLFLLFRVGLEVNASEMLQVGRTALVVAVLGVIVPFAAGYVIMDAYGYSRIEAIFMGAAMVATSVGITARVLDMKGLLSHAASKTILAAAVIDDVLGLLVLAVVSGMAKGNINVGEIAVTAGVSIAFTLFVVFWGARAMNRIVPSVDKALTSSESQFSMAMVLLFALSVLAMYAGVAAIIGAFLAGVALSESVSHRVHDLAQGVTELLVPFFLAGIGLHFDLTAVTNPSTLGLAMLILVAATLSKLVGCGVGALSMGRTNAVRIGMGMVPRGEVGMVVAQLGLGLGVVGKGTYSIVVFMAVMTTLIAPPMLTWAFRGEEGVPRERFSIG